MTVHGRLDGTLQRDGELTPDAVGKALGKEIQSYYAIPEVVEQRPPALCQGCGHRDMYEALNEVIAEYNGTAKVFGDIGWELCLLPVRSILVSIWAPPSRWRRALPTRVYSRLSP